jgi:hypothetical protein
MVLEPKVLGSNLDSVNSPPFKLNISRIGPHLLKGGLSPHVKGNVKLIIKWLNLPLLISLSFWNKHKSFECLFMKISELQFVRLVFENNSSRSY